MFTGVCLSMGGGGGWYPSMHYRWYPSMPCTRSPGGWYPSMPCRFPCPHPRGKSTGIGGSPGPHPRGKLRGIWSGPHPRRGVVPAPGGLLLGGVCSQGGGDLPLRDGYCCGQYASYWNAFLFRLYLHCQTRTCKCRQQLLELIEHLGINISYFTNTLGDITEFFDTKVRFV